MRSRVAPRYVLLLVLTFVLMAIAWPLGCFASREAKAIKRIGHHMDRIHKVDYDFKLDKIGVTSAAAAMYAEVEAIRKVASAIPDTAAIKQPLEQFLNLWTSAELIQGSLTDGRQRFMADVTGFYLQGFVERRESSKTLFPIFRP